MRRKIPLLTTVFVLLAGAVYAHPPTDITINYDPATQIVTAVIIHPVKDTTKHFINKADVSLNGREVVSLPFQQQETKVSQTVNYKLTGAKAGDVISIEGYCNLSGKLAKELKIK